MKKIELTEKQVLGMLSFIWLSSLTMEEEIESYEEHLKEREEFGCIPSAEPVEAIREMIARRKEALSCAEEVREKLFKAQ